MSNHKHPSVTVSTQVTVRVAVTVIFALIVTTALPIWLAVMLFGKGAETGDLLYVIGGAVALLLALPSLGLLIDIIQDWVDAR